MGPTPKKKKPNISLASDSIRAFYFIFIYLFIYFSLFSSYFFLRFTSFGPSEFVGINTKSALRDEGYA